MSSKKFSFIIGQNASKTARSPSVWNSWYDQAGVNTRMVAIDADYPEQCQSILRELENDEKCLGGAIAVPFKADAALYTKSELESVNCVYRDQRGKFVGENTDGIAGAHLIEQNISQSSNLYILGYGVTFKAIETHLSQRIKSQMKVFVRSSFSHPKHYRINDIITHLGNDADVSIFNATTLGGPLDVNGLMFSEATFAALRFNKIYNWIDINNEQEPVSRIQELCEKNKIAFVNGNPMNLHQAKIAFNLVNN